MLNLETCKRGHPRVGGRCRNCVRLMGRENKRKHGEQNRQRVRAYRLAHPVWDYGRRASLKVEVLTNYGPSGALRCSWPSCEVTDIDVLSLDHINDDGALHRQRVGSGAGIYHELRRLGFPSGFQTLCMNHQWKKRMVAGRGGESYLDCDLK